MMTTTHRMALDRVRSMINEWLSAKESLSPSERSQLIVAEELLAEIDHGGHMPVWPSEMSALQVAERSGDRPDHDLDLASIRARTALWRSGEIVPVVHEMLIEMGDLLVWPSERVALFG